MNKHLAVGAATLLLASPAAAMDLATFLRHADDLERMGLRAMVSSEGQLVMNALNESNRQLRAEREAAQRAGRRPAYCPDDHSRAGPQEILASLRTIPPARRARLQLKDALRAYYARRYPCRT